MRGRVAKRGKSWILVLDVGRDPNTGKRRQHFETLRTEREAERRLADLLKEAHAGSYVRPTKQTAGEYLRDWLETYARSHVRPLTFHRYRGIVEHDLVPVLGAILLSALQPTDVQAMHAAGIRRGLSARTVVQHHRVLSEALKHAERWGLVSRNVARLITPPRPEYREARFLYAAEAARFIDAARATPYFTMLALDLATGLRRGELLGLLWRDLDLDRGTLQVNRALYALPGRGLELMEVKSPKSRRQVALSPNAMLLLRRHREQVEATRAVGGETLSANALVFSHPDGRPISPNTVSHAFTRIARDAGIEGARLHSLRHSHASLLLAQGVDLKDIQTRLGHSSIAITGDLYAHLTDQRQREVAVRFDEALSIPPPTERDPLVSNP